MSVVTVLRRLRHGPLRRWAPLLTRLGNAYRAGLRLLPGGASVSRSIAGFGPFKLDARFAFTALENDSDKRNGIAKCVEAARGASCAIDIGAHVGFVALPLCQAVDGTVHCFEPSAANRELLRRNLALSGFNNAVVVDALVGATDDPAIPFYEPVGESPMGSTAARFTSEAHAVTSKQQVTLDTYCTTHGLRPALIKIDVEGAETNVIRGAEQTLKACWPTLVLSVHRKELAMLGSSIEELAALLSEIGYAILEMDGTPAERIGTSEYLCLPRAQCSPDAATAHDLRAQ